MITLELVQRGEWPENHIVTYRSPDAAIRAANALTRSKDHSVRKPHELLPILWAAY
jgi:hypothetical protein